MKYYRLKRDLPTFNEGDIFYIDNIGNLVSNKEQIISYTSYTIAKFPNILVDWFEEIPEPECDSKTKHAFMKYLSDHKSERFFQAVRNFTRRYLNNKGNYVDRPFIIASDLPPKALYEEDTFHWECDEMLKEDDEIQS